MDARPRASGRDPHPTVGEREHPVRVAQTPRFQGSGSSKVNPTRVVSLCEGVAARTTANYAPGYRLTDDPDQALLREAVALAERSETVVVCVGLTDIFESEGFDRDHMRIPSNQIALLEALAPLSERVVIVVVGGSAVEMPWEANAAAILHMQLAGQAGGAAAADLLFGDRNPSGKLAETYPMIYEDVVSAGRFGIETDQTPYLESMYCGYRYFDTANMPVRYPFGHGLSYTTFAYSDLEITAHSDHELGVAFTITNTGERDGAEVAQLYVAAATGGAYRPEQELKAFTKVAIPAGQRQRVTLYLDRRSFALYDPALEDWTVEAGAHEMRVGASSRDIRLASRVELTGATPRRSPVSDWYYTLQGKPTLEDFLTIHEPFPPVTAPHKGAFDENSSLMEMKEASLVCRMVYASVERTVAKRLGGKVDYSDLHFKMMMYSAAGLPMRAPRAAARATYPSTMVTMSDGAMPAALVQFVVDSANGHTLRGLWTLLRRRR